MQRLLDVRVTDVEEQVHTDPDEHEQDEHPYDEKRTEQIYHSVESPGVDSNRYRGIRLVDHYVLRSCRQYGLFEIVPSTGVESGIPPNVEKLVMGTSDKIRNEAENLSGKAKEAAGRTTGNEDLEAEGRGQQVEAELKKTGEQVKDTAKDIVD